MVAHRLSGFGLCIAIGGVLPAITNGADWLLVALGAAFGLLGVFPIGHGHLRRRSIDEAIERGEHLPVEQGRQMALTLFGVSLGTALVVILVVLEVRS